ncbi:hypothetical protein [Mycolicibacterium iranicum]|uniref:Uncharacterized protein n=1 Tax=Mycolicibacterium iranicum TaxID=912594 RepID=A0A178LXC0_MYCIR|nr:hypothetical protein [Mycolicibacterium iranicum]OAN38127.1 hypothetical protein A4X20_19995 [Mycolicibacterium iranicum]
MTVFIAIALAAAVCALHLRIRRHAGWATSAAGRAYILSGYSLTALAAYWLTSGSASWVWALGCTLSLAAAVSFAAGRGALKRVTAAHARLAADMETIEPATGTLRF